MSETLFKFLLTEIATIRVRCLGCGNVIEAPAAQLDTTFQVGRCPVCQNMLQGSHGNSLIKLAEALRGLAAATAAGKLEVEVAMPIKISTQ